MPYAAYERLRRVAPFADRPLSRDPVDLAIAHAGSKSNAAESAARRRYRALGLCSETSALSRASWSASHCL